MTARRNTATSAPTDGGGSEGTADSIFRHSKVTREDGKRWWFWMVYLSRQGRLITRSFPDSIYGGSDAALNMAVAYRDAVIAAIPPTVNREKAARRRSTNTSGIPGVHRGFIPGRGAFWEAFLFRSTVRKRKRFYDKDYGEEGGKQQAILLRQEWLAELPANFNNVTTQSDAVAKEHFADALAHVPHVLDADEEYRKGRQELERRLAEINERFDRLRPRRLSVSAVSRTGRSVVAVAVGDRGPPSKRIVHEFSTRTLTQGDALERVKQLLAEGITSVFDAETSDWFMANHGKSLTFAAIVAKGGFKLRAPVACHPDPSRLDRPGICPQS